MARRKKYIRLFDEDLFLSLQEIGANYEFYLALKIDNTIIRRVALYSIPGPFDTEYLYTFSYRCDGEEKTIKVDVIGETKNLKYSVLIGWGTS